MKVLAYTSPARGHLYPLVPILDELKRRGHETSVRTLKSQTELLRARGHHATPIATVIETMPHDDYLGRTPLAKMKRAMRLFGARGHHEIADLSAAIDDERPDVLLIDANCWGASAVAEASGLPWAQWFPYPLPLPAPDVPPFGLGLAPGTGPLTRVRDTVARQLTLEPMVRTVRPVVNEVRRKVGVAPLRTIEDLYTRPPRMLYMTAEPFEYHRSRWPENIRLIGPCAWDPPAAETPEWLREIDRPIVLVSTSSEFQDDGRLVAAAMEALAVEDVQVVATVPAGREATFETRRNARVVRFVPHGPVLERAVCAITHGGAGITQKALAHGVPVVAVPFGRDQFEVARRVQHAGAGVRVVGRWDARRLRAAVDLARTRTAGARRVADGFRRAGGPTRAADEVEGLGASTTHAVVG